jgi:hypothetical protein
MAAPSGPTPCASRRRAREGSACPLRRGVYALPTLFLFSLSPKAAVNPRIMSNHTNNGLSIRKLLSLTVAKAISMVARRTCSA